MNNLSDIFHELADSDERAFANAPRDTGAIAHARRARHRTRAAQATGGTFAVGALTVGGIQLIPEGDAGLGAAASPSAATSTVPSPTPEQSASPTDSVATTEVTFDTEVFSTIPIAALEALDSQFQCGAPAPSPTSGRAAISLDSVEIRSESFVKDFQPYIDGTESGPMPVVDAADNTEHPLIADLSIVGTGDDTLYADVPATMVLLAKGGDVVAVLAAGKGDPTEPQTMIPAPDDLPEAEAQDQPVIQLGADPVLTEEPASFTTGYVGGGCPTGFGDLLGDSVEHVYPPLGDYLEPGEYDAYAVARVIIDDQAAAEHSLREQDFELWNFWTHGEQAEQLGLVSTEVTGDEGEPYTHIEVPVPADHLPGEASDEVIVSEALTVTVP